MIYKYSYANSNDVLNYNDVEAKVRNALEQYKFIDGVEYDGEYINVVINSELKEAAKANEINLNKAIENLRKTC
ncbi:hypothetical protein [Tepidibacter formicigenes]|jgi:hypothetical protein|uniref:Uncharacterized protein n=1 Tax=Tepidibacter formicigenes DSM 15518 TaxID=1123349 RepID=A0A1M6PZI5_9FIRM|nr:hypothetical protein [Tepidibacter formicigenes]SHK13405.1 hypothetical protein SAMN02744037_01704 [Tepidibacter formicigenes DSM 15518]